MTTLFPVFEFQAANRSGAEDPEGIRRNVVRLSPYLRRATEPEQLDAAELHAYVDRVLDAGQRASVEAQLARHSEAGMIAAAYRRLNVDLHRSLDRDLPPLTASLEALSREFERRANTLSSPEARRRPAEGAGEAIRHTPAATAVVVSLLAIVGLTWLLAAGEPTSCSTRVETLTESAAKGRFAPELPRLEYETRRVRY